MSSIIVFDSAIFLLLLIEIYLLNKSSAKGLYEKAIIFTIIIYRLTTWIAIALGIHFEELGTSQWRYDHKWLGLTILFLVLIFWPKRKNTRLRSILLGISTGQIIDEISEFLILLGIHIPPGFRDTLPDLGLIILTLSLFLVIRNKLSQLKSH